MKSVSNRRKQQGSRQCSLQDPAIDNFLNAALGRTDALVESTSLKRIAFEAYLAATLRANWLEWQSKESLNLRVDFWTVLVQYMSPTALNALTWQLAFHERKTQEVQGAAKNKELTLKKKSLVVLKSSDDKVAAFDGFRKKFHYVMVRRALSCQFARTCHMLREIGSMDV